MQSTGLNTCTRAHHVIDVPERSTPIKSPIMWNEDVRIQRVGNGVPNACLKKVHKTVLGSHILDWKILINFRRFFSAWDWPHPVFDWKWSQSQKAISSPRILTWEPPPTTIALQGYKRWVHSFYQLICTLQNCVFRLISKATYSTPANKLLFQTW